MEAEIKKLQEFYWSDADPDGRGFVNLADAYRKGGDPDEALRILRDGLRRHPDLASGHVVAGWLYADQGDASDAEASFRAALDLDSDNVSALRGLAEILSGMGDSQGALESFRTLLPLDPLDGGLANRVAELEAEVPEPPAEQIPTTQEEAPEPTLWDSPEDAAEELNWEAAALQEDQSGDSEDDEILEGLDEEFETDLRADDSSAEALKDDTLITKTMGEVLLRQGLLDESEQVFQQLLQRDPDDPELREKLDHIQALRRGEVALEAFGPGSMVSGEDGLPADGVVSIKDLTADVIVPIGELAPDSIVGIASLAPDQIVPIESLAPDPTDGDPAVDAFEDWLDNLP